MERWKNICNLPFAEEDRNLIFFDFLEEILHIEAFERAQSHPEEILASLLQNFDVSLQGLDDYEMILLQLWKREIQSISEATLNQWRKVCSPLSYIKVLILAQSQFRDVILQKALIFSIQGASSESQKILKRKYRHWINDTDQATELRFDEESLIHGTHQMRFRRSGFENNLINLLLIQPVWNLEDMLKSLYQVLEIDFYIQEKFRIALMRFNKKAESHLQIHKIVQSSKGNVSLNKSLNLICHKDQLPNEQARPKKVMGSA